MALWQESLRIGILAINNHEKEQLFSDLSVNILSLFYRYFNRKKGCHGRDSHHQQKWHRNEAN